MTPERWQHIKATFQKSLETPEEARLEWLASVCGDDLELFEEVQSLLSSYVKAGGFLDTPATVSELQIAEWPAMGDQLGVYRIVQRIGEGGMSVVYQGVRDDDEFRRLVAIKVLKRGMDTDFLVRRFRKERQILAHFDHPNIAKIFDGGSTPDGRPYFVMEFIAGETIDQYCDNHRLSIKQRLELFLRICNGVEYAHQNLVVHRDLKPSNILVTEDGHPKLLDFGIAKMLEDERDITVSYLRLMTPEYASPEQAAGGAITTRSDIYTLGVILFELLTGQKPHKLRGRSLAETREALAHEIPPRPSTAISRAEESVVEMRGARRERLRRALEDDIDNIVGMAMRKESVERYAAVGQMAADIRRHFAGEPIIARKDSVGYRSRKFVQRHSVGVAATAAVILALTVGFVAALYSANVANRQRAIAEQRYDLVRGIVTSMLGEVHDAITPLAGSTTARELIVRRAQEYLDSLARDGGASIDRERAEAYLRVGDVLGNPNGPNLGDAKGALANYRQSLELNRALAAANPQDQGVRTALAASHQRICAIQNRTGEFKAALESCSETVRLTEEAARAQPSDLNTQGSLALAYTHLAEPYVSLGDWDRAREFGEKALAAFESLQRAEPNREDWKREIAASHHSLAAVDEQSKRFVLARAHAEKAVAGFEARAVTHPDDAAAQLQPTFALQRLGSILIALGDLKSEQGDTEGALGDWREGLAAFEKSLPVRERLLALDPKDARARLNLLRSHNSVGYSLLKLGDAQHALEHFRIEERLAKDLVEKDPTPVDHQTALATAQYDIGLAWRHFAESSTTPADRRTNWMRARPYFARALEIANTLQSRGALRADYTVIHERFKAEVAACERALAL